MTTISDRSRAEHLDLMLDIGIAHAVDPDPVHAVGTVGKCWSNAQAFCRQDLDRYCYVEGIVRRAPGERWEMHGYVLDREHDRVVETTTGYAASVEYRGMELDLPAVDAWFAANPDEDHEDDDDDLGYGRPPIVWLKLWIALEQGRRLNAKTIISTMAEAGWRPRRR